MPKPRSGSVSVRLDRLHSIFSDLRTELDRAAQAHQHEELRAALIVSARALNLFVGNFSISDRLADTVMVQLNSRMLRLSSDITDQLDVYSVVSGTISSVLDDISEFQSQFTEDSVVPLSSQVPDELRDDDPDEYT